MTTRLTRRAAMITAAGTLAAPALMPQMAAATERPMPPAIPLYRRMRLGDFTVTTLLTAAQPMDNPQGTFGMNASREDFAALSAAHFIPADRGMSFHVPTLVDTGSEVILFDTGINPGAITAALAAAGHAPEDVSLVVITHMHGDHIGGLHGDGPTFTKARYVTGQAEFDHWNASGNETFAAKVKPLAAEFGLIGDGDSPAPGITAMLAPGHTPGHMTYLLESGGRRLMLTADTANHYVWSLGQPDWEVRFDMDKALAAETRRRILGQIAEQKIPFIGYHMPFPGVGFLQAEGPGYRFVPASYQLDL